MRLPTFEGETKRMLWGRYGEIATLGRIRENPGMTFAELQRCLGDYYGPKEVRPKHLRQNLLKLIQAGEIRVQLNPQGEATYHPKSETPES